MAKYIFLLMAIPLILAAELNLIYRVEEESIDVRSMIMYGVPTIAIPLYGIRHLDHLETPFNRN